MKGNGFSVIILDIDDFKVVNDTHGHDHGDRILRAVATIIRSSFGKNFICYRFGGDEFAIVSNETDITKIESRLKEMVEALANKREDKLNLPTISYGYSIFTAGEQDDFYRVIQEADCRMYQ